MVAAAAIARYVTIADDRAARAPLKTQSKPASEARPYHELWTAFNGSRRRHSFCAARLSFATEREI